MLKDVMAAVRRERARLLDTGSIQGVEPLTVTRCFKPGEVTAMLRVEYARDVAITLQSEFMAMIYETVIIPHLTGRDGPITVEGVAYYMVERLPMPGWRVINPMSA
jgi:uncharacterized membrane protein